MVSHFHLLIPQPWKIVTRAGTDSVAEDTCGEDVVSCKMQLIYQLGPGPDAITIFQEWGMSSWKLDTLFIYVGV